MSKSSQSTVRQMSSQYGGSRVAAADYHGTVSVWDLVTRKRVSTFDTPMDFGGKRLAIHPNGHWCTIASWHYNGVACYHCETSELVWATKNIRRPQNLSYSADGRRLYCGCENRPCAVLSAKNGRKIGSLAAVDAVYFSQYQRVEVRERRKRQQFELRTANGKVIAELASLSFAILDVGFGPASVCVSESAGPVRCFDSSAGLEIWRTFLGKESMS